MTTKGVSLEDTADGRLAVITAPWRDSMLQELLRSGISQLELNDGKGWSGENIEFLAALPNLRSLKIIDLKLSSVQPIHYLHDLCAAEIITYCDTPIDFSAFPYLEECALNWRQGCESIFRCKSLKNLFVDNYSDTSTDGFGYLTNLESLAIMNAPTETLSGLGTLQKLKSLRLGNLGHLASLAGIENMKDLEELEVHTCKKIDSIEEIGNLARLKKLYLNNDGAIESLRPIDSLSQLESVIFYESTNILDGDLSPLVRQKHLSRVSFQNRRHYSHRREQFPQ